MVKIICIVQKVSLRSSNTLIYQISGSLTKGQSPPSVLGALSPGSGNIATVLTDHEEASSEHLVDGVLSLDGLSLLGRNNGQLLLEAFDGLELVLDGLLLGKGGSLGLEDLLLGASSGRGGLHPI